MLIVTHEMGFALSVADEILFMENGQIAERGTPEELMTNPGFDRTRRFIGRIRDFTRAPGEG